MSRQKTVFKQSFNAALALVRMGEALPSEPELGARLGVSRTTVRAILLRMAEQELIHWNGRDKVVMRAPAAGDFFPVDETDAPPERVERIFMRRLLKGGEAGTEINELELARASGVGTTSVREFLIRFSRFGLIEKRPNRHWRLKGFTRSFALELAEIREMFELRSAQAFATLGKADPAWAALDRLEREHLDLRAGIAQRFSEFSELDERFHRLVHSASQNRFIVDFYDVIAMIFHYHYQWNKADERQRNEAALDEHLAYLAALRSGDVSQVEEACRRHLRSARATLLRSMPADP